MEIYQQGRSDIGRDRPGSPTVEEWTRILSRTASWVQRWDTCVDIVILIVLIIVIDLT